MSAKTVLTGIGIWFLVFWELFLLAAVLTVVGTFVIPSMVPAWKAQGLTEVPYGLQFVVDFGDFFIHRWYAAVPILFGVSFVI